MNDEITKFSMADEDDYDEYEEEVIERDEEYDDGEEYEDEEYEDEYDDEEYEDEDYDDEEYDEDEDYDDEEYDDGYDNQYYDDRLNQVLDELAELKRNMTPAVQQPQSPILPVQPHIMFGMPQNNEVVMYNEISRLRDELNRTQNSQTMHEELSRLKEDMERDKRQNEAQFLNEIKRLNERIEELQTADRKPALAAANQNAGLLPEAQHALPPKELGKLVGVSETLLKSTRDSDAHILADIAELKSKLESIVNPENEKAIAQIKESVQKLEESNKKLEDSTQKLEESTQKLEERPAPADYSEALEAISARVSELKDKMGEASNEPVGVVDQKLINKLARIKTESNSVDLTEIMRSVYELKGMLGSSDSGRNELVNMALKAYTDLDLLHATIANSSDLRTKLEAVENFVSSVNAQDFITSDALTAYNIVLKSLMNTPLDRAAFDSLNSFASATGKITVNSSKKEAINRYISFAERTKREDVDGIIEFLPELISAINDAEGAKNVSVLGGLRDEIQAMYDERNKANDTDKHNVDAEIKALVSELTNLTVGDVVSYAPAMPLPTSDAVSFSDGDSVSDRINAILDAVSEISLTLQSLPAATAAPSEDDVAATSPAEAEIVAESADGNVYDDIENLKNMLLALDAKINTDELLNEVQRNFSSVAGRLANIENKLASASVPVQEIETDTYEAQPYAPETVASVSSEDLGEQTGEIVDRISEKLDSVLGEDLRDSVLAELSEIKDKLSEQEMFVSQIADLRTDLLALPESLTSSAQFDKLYEDIVAQFDKLYDDITAVDGENNEKLNATLDDIKNAIDGIASSDMSATVLDGIVDFRTAYEESQALSAADRNKLLEDLAFVRSGVEQRLQAQSDETVHNSDIAAQISALGEQFDANIKALEEKIAALEVSESEANEQNGSVGEQIDNLAASVDERFAIGEENAVQLLEGQQSVFAALDELKEKSAAIEDAVNSNALLLTENETSISEHVNKVLELLMPQGDADGTNIYDELMSISRRVDEIHSVYEKSSVSLRDSIAEIKEQIHLKELEQSLAATSVSEEERNKVLTEISDLRERMSELENSQQLQSDTVATQLDKISEQITDFVAAIPKEDKASAEEIQAIAADIAEIKEKLSSDNTDEDALNMQLLMSDVSEIKDKLSSGAEATSDIVRMQDDLTFIRNQIEATIESAPEDDSINQTLENEGLSLIMDDIAAIKDKLSSLDEYDTVAEILSLREDVKTARLLDNSDVAAELESLKGDLAELKADVTDIKTLRSDGDAVVISGDGAPTSDEVNMLLGEIVSLRDEIQAYKDDVTNMVTSSQDDIAPVTAVADENIAVILEELTGLHTDIDNIKLENLAEQAGEIEDVKAALAEIKDMISRRTTLPEEGAPRDTAVSNELNVVLDEIINVKDEVANLKAEWSDMTETAAAERESDAAAEKAALADGLEALKSELFSMIGEKLDELSAVSPDFVEELQSVKTQLADLQAVSVSNAVSEDGVGVGGILLDEITEIKQMLSEKTDAVVAQPESAISLEELYGEVLELRRELQDSHAVVATPAEGGAVTVDLAPINEQLSEIRAALADMPATSAAVEVAPDEAVLGEVLSLREEVAALKDQIANISVAAPVEAESDTMVLGEVLSLREEIASLKEQLSEGVAQASESDRDSALLGEILGLREELERMRESASTPADDTAGLMESIGSIREDVRSIKDEPDLSIINEVLALRDEFQAFKDELNKTRTAPAEDKSKDELIAEVQSLRDQLFAISMANVNDGTSNEVVYESYNNIILDEISSLRDEIALIKQSDNTRALGEEISVMKDKLTNLAVDDSEKTEARFDELRAEIAKLKTEDNDIGNNVILDELAALKEELDRRRDAEELTQNFMSEMARILERQNAYLGQASNERLVGEIESLKTEIASSLAVPATSEDLKSEIESLKAELGRNRTQAVAVDNGEVLKELAALRNEIGKHNSSEESKKILSEIARLKTEIGAISDREQNDDGALSQSINDLKAELTQLAGIVDDKEEPTPAVKKASAPAKTTRKKGTKSGTKRKSPAKPKKQPPVNEDNGLTSESLLSKIDSTSFNLGGSSSEETIVLNPNFEPDPIPSTSEEMDIAAKIAKQVANKLIMEQLVQQLGDGSVPHSEVEEIVKDILPQEFTTIQVDEQTDKVRRLANSLVLDKLRSRLKK